MKTVLLVEDNFDIRENATEMLELAGYKVITAANGKLGLETAKAEQPDIILSDIMMPVMGGREFLKELRNDPSVKNIPFVFITSSVEKKEVEEAYALGADGYIYKPFDEKELQDAISKGLAARKPNVM